MTIIILLVNAVLNVIHIHVNVALYATVVLAFAVIFVIAAHADAVEQLFVTHLVAHPADPLAVLQGELYAILLVIFIANIESKKSILIFLGFFWNVF